MSAQVQRSGSWGPCHDGTLVHLAEQQCAADRRRQLVQMAITGAAVLLLFAVGLIAGLYWLPYFRSG